MSIMNLFKKNKKEQVEPKGMRLGFVLFDSQTIDWGCFTAALRNDWDIEVSEEPTETGQLVFDVDGMMVGCGFVEACVPNGEAEKNAKNNFLWKEAVQTTQTHKAYLILSVMRGEDVVERNLLFTKVASSFLKLENAIAIYQNPTVIASDVYIHAAEDIKEGHLPILNWIYVGIYSDKNKFSGYTYGMVDFGKAEIEVIRTDKQSNELYEFLLDIAGYVIEMDATLNHGETIGFSEEQKLKITRSKGVSVENDSLKIDF